MPSKLVAALAAAVSCLPPAAATPAAGGEVKEAPARLTLTFSEGIEARFSSAALTGPSGRTVAVEPPSVSGPNGTVPSVTVGARLATGTYAVRRRAASVDRHKTRGSDRFTIAP